LLTTFRRWNVNSSVSNKTVWHLILRICKQLPSCRIYFLIYGVSSVVSTAIIIDNFARIFLFILRQH
jgi:hypothetical protein